MDYKFLGKINSPEELKKLDAAQITLLCGEIRDKIIGTVSKNGGHLASNLGTVELTVALHRSFNSPSDSIIFDVGHQCYTHKLLTGRYEQFDTLRALGGISGFMRPSESVFDPFVTGHSSNSVSAATGIAKADTLLKNGNYTVAVVGDGAFGGGMIFEGLNNAVVNNDKLIVIYNDNKMSISQNVGAIARALTKVRTNATYYRFKKSTEKFLEKIPIIGKPLKRSLYNSKLMLKHVIYHSNYFEDLGYAYLGPVDGHDVEKLERILKIAKASKRPVIVHVLTVKGRGYKFAEAKPGNYHGVSPFDIDNGVESSGKRSFSSVAGTTLVNLAKTDDKICAVTAAMTDGTCLTDFAVSFPKRFFDVGIAEEHAVTFCAGLAAKGYKPFFAVYSTFLQRAYDQILHDAAIANLPVTVLVDRAGFVGNDGETHQGVFDISVFSSVPNVKIFSPSGFAELSEVIKKAAKRTAEVWLIRYPRGGETECELSAKNDYYDVFSSNGKTAVISYGITFSYCVNALNNTGIDFIKLNCVNFLPDELIARLTEYENIYFFEETVQRGSVAEMLALRLLEIGYKGKFKSVAVPTQFVPQGTQAQQRDMYNLSTEKIRTILSDDCVLERFGDKK